MVSSWEEGKICHRSINACLCPLYAIEGMHVVTVEGKVSQVLQIAPHLSRVPASLACPLGETEAATNVRTHPFLLRYAFPIAKYGCNRWVHGCCHRQKREH